MFELKSIFPRIDPRGFKTRINQKVISLDIYIPELNLGIEFDGHHWHKDKTDFDSMKSKKIRGAGFNLFRIREEPLEKLSDEDIISKIPFNPKNIVRDILAQIEERLSISSKTQGLFNQYNRNKTLVNDKELDEYIEEVLRMNPDK